MNKTPRDNTLNKALNSGKPDSRFFFMSSNLIQLNIDQQFKIAFQKANDCWLV